MPLALAWEDSEEERHRALAPAAVAKVRQQASVGLLADAVADERFARAVLDCIGSAGEIRGEGGALVRGRPSNVFTELAGAQPSALPVRVASMHSSNSTIAFADRLFLKIYRRVEPGINPEAEIGRFLTEVAHFRHAVPVAGTLDFVGGDGVATTIALLQGYVENQGDGFDYSVNYLAQYLEQRASETATPVPSEPHGGYLALVRTLGQRTGELHAALAMRSGDPAFEPEVSSAEEIQGWCASAVALADRVLDRLNERLASLSAAVRAEAEAVLRRRADIATRLSAGCAEAAGTMRMRLHGDYHLGQVLLAQNDFIIADFEGEPARSLPERRRKQSPLKDVAGMLRSFDYATQAALIRASAGRPDQRAALVPHAKQWREDTVAAFLQAYRTTIASAGLFANWGSAEALLSFFVLEKAMYELGYEIDNRPDWVPIPLRGIAAALGDSEI